MKTIPIILLALILASCHNYKKDAEQMQVTVDSLKTVTNQKDSVIGVFLNDFTEIQANLDSIKKMEMLMTGVEKERVMSNSDKEKILSDIATINALLRDNQEQILSLRNRIRNSNLKTGRLEEMVNELEQQTKTLEQNLKMKNSEVAHLGEQVEERNQNISHLEQRLSLMTELNTLKTDTLRMQEAELNKAFFTFGSVSELRDNGIVDRQGGILGIGSTPVIRKDFTHNYFTETEITEFQYLPLNTRKADVLSIHPVESFHISGENSADTLFIDNPETFWSATKYLVVAVR